MASKALGVNNGFNSIVVGSIVVRGDLSPAAASRKKEHCYQSKYRWLGLEGRSSS